METKLEQSSATNPNPVVSVGKDGTVLYSNAAGEPLLHEWGVGVGEKLPFRIRDFVQRVISRNSPEKMEVKVGNRVYLVAFHPSIKEDCVNIYGFDISDQKELEERLRESEIKYRNIVETSIEGIWIFNAVSETTYVNEKMAEMLGYKPEEMVGRFIWDFAYEEDKDIFQIKLANRKQAIDEVYELKLIRKDGSPLWVSISAKGFFDDAGKFAGSVGMFTDITERKKVEEALRESEERFRSAFDDSAVAMALVCPDARFMKVNDAFCRLLGFEKSEMEGSTFLDFTYPDDMEPSILTHKAVINREEPFFWLEKRYIRKDGRVIWCEVSSSPVFDSKGCPIYTVAHVQDITERKEAEEALKKEYDTLEEKVKERTSELEKAYASLKESEKGLAEAQEMAQIGNWKWDIATDKAYWSEEMYRIFKRDPQKLAPSLKEYLSYIHPDDLDYYCKVNDYTTKVRTSGLDFRIVLANGEERTLHIKSDFIFNDEDIPIRVKGVVQDITEHKKAEERIKTLANIVESSEDAIGTISLDGIVTSWNKGAEQVYGYSAEEILGKSLSTLTSPHLDKESIKLIEKIKQGEKVINYETLRLRKDGKVINVSITLSPVFNISEKLAAVSFISRDITEKKRSEEKLRDSEEKYRNIVETANEGISLIDNEFKLIYVNKKIEDMLGYSSEEVIGRPMWDFISDESKHIVKSILERGLQDFENPELKYIRKDGSHLWAQVNAKPIFDNDGKFKGIMTMLTDITKRKEAEETLNKIDIARKQEIHHRIKNNLQVISSLLDLQAEKFIDTKVIEAFRESQNRVISMALIHEELYKEEGTDTLNFSEYLKMLAENLFQTYRLSSNNIHLNIDMEENVLFNMDTAVPLGIIVNELISNSLKHAFSGREKGEIQIKLQRDEKGECKTEGCKSTNYTLTVSDNGVGIPENLDIEDLDTLGLQLVTSLVDQLDGELELKRDNGTEFTIKFTVTEE